MNVDLTNLPASLIMAGATLLAASIAGVTVWLSTWMNTRSASRLARDAARREFKINAIKPYLDSIDRHIALYHDFIAALPPAVALLERIPTLTHQELIAAKPDFDASMQQWRTMAATLTQHKDMLSNNTGLLAFVVSDRKVMDKFVKWLEEARLFWEVVVPGGITATPETLETLATPEKLKTLEGHVSEALSAAIKLRLTIEEFMFGRRGWLCRGTYYAWSRSCAAWRKWKRKRLSASG
jgi:hypothetical protein